MNGYILQKQINMQATQDNYDEEDQDGKRITNDCFFIRNNLQLIRVNWNDICWVHAEGNYCNLVTADKRFAVKSSLKKILSKLPMEYFLQIHKAYVVKINCIEKIDLKDNVVIALGNHLPIGRIYKDILLEQLDII